MSANKWFDRVIFWTRERPTSGDWNKAQTSIAETLRILTKAVFGEAYASAPTTTQANAATGQAPEGFLNDGFRVVINPSAGPMVVSLTAGYGVQSASPTAATDYSSATGLNIQALAPAPLTLSSAQNITVPASETAGNSRIDIIEVRADYMTTESTTVGIFNSITRVFDPTAQNKTFTWDLLTRTGSVVSPASSTAPISYKKGVAFAGGIAGATEPSTTPGYIKIARINLDGSVTSLTQGLIADLRPPLLPNGNVMASGRVTVTGGSSAASSTFDGVHLPPGVQIKLLVETAAADTDSTRYGHFYVLGGGINARNAAYPSLVLQPTNYAQNPAVDVAAADVVDATVQSYLDGSNGSYEVINGAETYALGTPCYHFRFRVYNGSGNGTISASLAFLLHFSMS